MFMSVDDVVRIIEAFFKEVLKVVKALQVALGMREEEDVQTEEPSSGT